MKFFEILWNFRIIGHCHAYSVTAAEKVAWFRYAKGRSDWSMLSVREVK